MTIPNPEVLLTYIASQTRGNLEFLVSQGQLPETDCRSLLDKLKSIEDISRITQQTQDVAIASTPTSPPTLNSPAPRAESSSSVTPEISAPKPRPTSLQVLFRVRALWNYNEHNQEPRDLSFSAGDMIDVLRETNADWWEGRCNGKTGLFPSNYVEKVKPISFPSPSQTGENPTSYSLSTNYQYPYYPPLSVNPYISGPATYPNSAPETPAVSEGEKSHKPKKDLLPGNVSDPPTHHTAGGVGFVAN